MRPVVWYVSGIALLLGCADRNGLPTDPSAGNVAESPSFAGAEVERGSVGIVSLDDVTGLLLMTGFAESVTLADLCAAGPEDFIPNSPNSITQIVLPPPGGFLAPSHGRDVPLLVYEFEGDPCDGVGETLIASGTGQFHFSITNVPSGASINNLVVRGTVDLVSGGEALLTVVGAVFNQSPDGELRVTTGTIELTPI